MGEFPFSLESSECALEPVYLFHECLLLWTEFAEFNTTAGHSGYDMPAREDHSSIEVVLESAVIECGRGLLHIRYDLFLYPKSLEKTLPSCSVCMEGITITIASDR